MGVVSVVRGYVSKGVKWAYLTGDGGTLVGGLKLGHQLGLEFASLLGVKVAHLKRGK